MPFVREIERISTRSGASVEDTAARFEQAVKITNGGQPLRQMSIVAE